jgi:hypothetical protein
MCSILCWILYIWEALGWKFCIFGLIHALPTRGRSLILKWLAGCIYKVFRWFRAISGLCCAPVWPVEVTGLTGQSAGPVHMLSTGLTGGGDRSDRCELSWCSYPVSSGVLHAFVQGELHWFRGSSLWFVELCFGGLRSLLEFCFVSDVSSRCPCLRGSRLVFSSDLALCLCFAF